MKYTKKMQLVELDSEKRIRDGQFSTLPLDKNYAAPRVLSTLDGLMSEILNTSNTSDSDKWTLYNQTLQRYLNYAKHNINNLNQSQHNEPVQQPNANQETLNESFHHRNEDQDIFREGLQDISGILPIRDSLDSITQPAVREFFEKARENIDLSSSSPSLMSFEEALEDSSRKNTQRGNRRNNSRPPNKRKIFCGLLHTPPRGRPKKTTVKRAADSGPKKSRNVVIKLPRWDPTISN